jgi:small subunit ribosomal protein S6
MRRYETIFIITPDSSDEELKAVQDKYRGLVTGMDGLVTDYNEQGKKRLAYEVKKQNKGYYVLMDYVGSSDLVAELERNMRLEDRILKYLTIKITNEVDPASIQVQESDLTQEEEPAAASEPEDTQSPEVEETDQEES